MSHTLATKQKILISKNQQQKLTTKTILHCTPWSVYLWNQLRWSDVRLLTADLPLYFRSFLMSRLIHLLGHIYVFHQAGQREFEIKNKQAASESEASKSMYEIKVFFQM